MSLINLGVGIASANAITMATVGTNVGSFLLDGWFGRAPSTATDNSWEVSLKELVSMGLGGTGGVASSYKWKGEGGLNGIVKRNLATHGAASVVTIIAAPIVGKAIKRLARTPIRQFNNLWKMAGLEQATGVKL